MAPVHFSNARCNLCQLDGACVEVCPVDNLSLPTDDGTFVVISDHCIECGACVSACPNAALSID